ncbi:cytochrome P450 [Haliea sp. E1-2-M8]|uniref:cytochrome P450 n=1 Tax=Haliea sp. E1-2-M8 TaxID=3064706 RepID=UPI00271CB437|nr:cytochrome P450 [Haliea sp. E1-2-M8]MDO8862828.1 cytochrome P450 [Haliea sp. E1-2-M8]
MATHTAYTLAPDCGDLAHLPGEFGWPLLGITPELLRDQLGLARRFYRQYGPVSRIQMARQRGVLALGPDLAQTILLDKEQNFSAKMGYQWSLTPYFGEHYLLGNDFDEHKFQRRIMQTGFKTAAMRGYVELMNPILEQGIEHWDQLPDFRFFPQIKELLLAMALKVFYGVEGGSAVAGELSRAFIDITEGMLGLFHVDLPGFRFRRGQRGRHLIEAYLSSLLPAAREEERRDMLAYMAKETRPDGELFSDQELVDHANFLLFAAHDTTTSTLTHMMYYLARYPEWQQRIREEGRAVNLAGPLDYDDLPALPLLEAAFFESQRLHPSVGVMVRRTIRDCKLGEVDVLANTQVFQFPMFTNRMQEYWRDPDSFDPDRFLPPRQEQKGHPFAFMPFGGGAHKCIGMHFGNMQARLFSHLFLQRYEISLPPGHKASFQTVPLPKLRDDLPLRLRRL